MTWMTFEHPITNGRKETPLTNLLFIGLDYMLLKPQAS